MTPQGLGWTAHEDQRRAAANAARYAVISCGRRWGKSSLAAMVSCGATTYRGQYIRCVAPTYDLSGITFETALVALQRRGWVREHSRSEHRLVTVTGGILEARSADNPESLLGRGPHGVIMDEAAAMPERIWYQYVLPGLADHLGWAILIGTPRGRSNWFYDCAMRAQEGDPEWSHHTGPASANRVVYRGGAEDVNLLRERERFARAKMLPLFEQEFMGSFAHLQGRVFEAWDPKRHVCHDPARLLAGIAETYLVVDWGHRNPCAILVLGRTFDDNWRILDEWYEQGKTLPEIVTAAQGLWARYHCAGGWGDPAEPGYLEECRRNGVLLQAGINDIFPGNMEVADALGRDGGLLVAPKCTNTQREFEDYVYPTGTRTTSGEKPVDAHNHAMSALRYGVYTWTKTSHQIVTPTRVEYEANLRPRKVPRHLIHQH